MGRDGMRLPLLCSGRLSARVQVRSSSVDTKPIHDTIGKRIMVVVDTSMEAKEALQWALSNVVYHHDTIVLLRVEPSSKQGVQSESYELLHSMREFCQSRRPEVRIELFLVEGEEQGPTIVKESKRQRASLLVLRQIKRSAIWHFLMMCIAGRSSGGIAEYCIQNATCMTFAVRKKGRRGGGFLLTSQRHKDFWLLA